MRTGQARKRDGNEREIVRALRSNGVTVIPVSGAGAPDLLCCAPRVGWLPIEVKSFGGKLTRAQARQIIKSPYPVVRTVTEALALFGIRGPAGETGREGAA